MALSWQAIPASSTVEIDWDSCQPLYARALKLLDANSAVVIPENEVAEYLAARRHSNFPTTRPANGQAILLRGVAHGYPIWSRIWINSDTGAAWVHEGSWNGENLLSYAAPQIAWPVLIFCDEPPKTVYTTFIRGGDGIMVRGAPTTPPVPQKIAGSR